MTTTLNDQHPPTQHQWELCKENAAPLQQGRNVTSLSRALAPGSKSSKPHTKDTNDSTIRRYEKLIGPCERFAKEFEDLQKRRRRRREDKKIRSSRRGYNEKEEQQQHDEIHVNDLLRNCGVPKDPLIHWLQYIQYIEETYPSDTHAQFLLLERCTLSLLQHPLYSNDPRFVRVCVLYADRTSSPNDTFKYLHQHKIGDSTAVFWMAWAWTAEKRNDFPFAEKIFRKALQKKAKPMKVVEDRYKQFHRRMSRHWLNNSKSRSGEGGAGAGGENDDGNWEGGGQNQEEDDEEGYNRRGALSGLTEEGVRYNHRGRGVNSIASSNRQQSSSRNTVSSKHKHTNHGVGGGGGGKFKIFTGSNDKENTGYNLNQSTTQDGNDDADYESDDHIPYQTLRAKEEQRTKENNEAPGRWNERGGLHGPIPIYNDEQHEEDEEQPAVSSVAQRWAGTDGIARVAGGTASQQAFQVYVDEECVAKNEKEKEKEKEEGRKQMQEYPRGIGIRQRADGSIKSSIHERPFLSKQPLDIIADRPLPDISGSRTRTSSSLGMVGGVGGVRGGIEGVLKQPRRSKTQTSDTVKNDGKDKPVCGFDKKLLSQGRNGRETCFEECRARGQHYTTVSPDQDFNLLHCREEGSFMDVDELSTIQDVSMEEDSPVPLGSSSPSLHKPEKETKKEDNSKPYVDEPQNTSCAKDDSFMNNEGSQKATNQARRVLFGTNTTITNHSNANINHSQNNASLISAASSTVDEQDAVGVPGEKEETINTKIACRELSMMFYSPCGAGNDKDVSASNVKLNMSTLHAKPLFSIRGKERKERGEMVIDLDRVMTPKQLNQSVGNVDSLRDAGPNAGFSIFCDEDDTAAPNNDGGNSSSDDSIEEVKFLSGFPINDNDENDKHYSETKKSSTFPIFSDVENNIGPEKKVRVNTKASSTFPIFCDDDNSESEDNSSANDPLDEKAVLAFPVFCDDENAEPKKKHDVNILQPRETNKFTIFEDTDVKETGKHVKGDAKTAKSSEVIRRMDDSICSSSDGEENEDTVNTMALLNFKEELNKQEQEDALFIKESDKKAKKETKRMIEKKEKVEFSKCFGQDDSTVLTEDLFAFGDISQIVSNDPTTVSSLEENLKEMAVSKRTRAEKNIIDYKIIHRKVTEEALEDILEVAKQQKQKIKKSPSAITQTIFDRTNKYLPKGLRKVPKKGTEIDIGGFEFVVKSLLGRGAYGTVLLCDSPTSSSNFALKVQTPTGSLAWEHEILDVLDERIRSSKRMRITRDNDDSVIPFPKVQSFVAFSDGGVMGMTAGSDLGVTLVDVVNAYEGGAVPELVAIHYTSRMLLHLETLHVKGKVLHCDIKPDNWVLTSSSSSQNSFDSRPCPIGLDLMLVDFGRALDLTTITKNSIDPFSIDLHGDIAAKDMECGAMRQNKSWCIDLDTYGLCASTHVLLFGCYMDICETSCGSSKRWEPKKKFRRYWQQNLWRQLFDTLLNINQHDRQLKVGEYEKKIREIRQAFEDYLDKSKHRKEVVTLLREQASKLQRRN